MTPSGVPTVRTAYLVFLPRFDPAPGVLLTTPGGGGRQKQMIRPVDAGPWHPPRPIEGSQPSGRTGENETSHPNRGFALAPAAAKRTPEARRNDTTTQQRSSQNVSRTRQHPGPSIRSLAFGVLHLERLIPNPMQRARREAAPASKASR